MSYEQETQLPAVIVLMGVPGAGKGTLAARLCKERSMVHISTGDLFRKHIEMGTELGRQAKECIDQGLLVPDELTLRMLSDRLDYMDVGNARVILIDGFPRTFEQARALLAEIPHLRAILLTIDENCMRRRLSGRLTCPACNQIYNVHYPNYRPKVGGHCDACPEQVLRQRDDDATEGLAEKRWATFVKQTIPAVEFYKALGKVVEYDGETIGALPIEDLLSNPALFERQ